MSAIPHDFLKVNFCKGTESWTADIRTSTEKKIYALARRLEINKEIGIQPTTTSNDISSCADLTGKAWISINVGYFKKLSDEHQEFALAHELSHIKHYDYLSQKFIKLVFGITNIALILLFPNSLSPWFLILPSLLQIFTNLPLALTLVMSPQAVVAAIITVFSYSIFSKWREVSADKTALSVCSKQAGMEAWRLFKNQQEQNIADWNKMFGSHFILRLFGKIYMSEDGNLRFFVDCIHPSLQTRINYLRPVAISPPHIKKRELRLQI